MDVPFGEILEAEPELIVVSVQLGIAGNLRQEDLSHFQRTLRSRKTVQHPRNPSCFHATAALLWLHLVDGGSHGALQHHLQHLGVGRVLVGGEGQLLGLLLHVLYGHLDGRGDNLRTGRRFRPAEGARRRGLSCTSSLWMMLMRVLM